ncbi:MAG TPA: serine hydrolase [Xanthomonadales bacterium]|nr:serine hydrolase [Xanthomonadales bacterium]
MRRRDALIALGLCTVAGATRAASGDSLLTEILRAAGPQSRRILASPDEFELQVLWTRCERADADAWRVAGEHSLGVQQKRWFAAASFVKLPLAALLLEQLCARGLIDQIGALRVTVDAGPACAPLPASTKNGWPMLRLLRAMCVVSDNLAYNALYELLGSDAIHRRLAELGYADCRVAARLGCGGAMRPGKLAARVVDAAGKLVWDSPRNATEQPQLFPFGSALKGRAWAEGGKQIAGPHDFSDSNFMPLPDVHRMMLELASGQALGDRPAFALCPKARALLAQIMALTPRACPDPVYVPDQFANDHAKWLIPLDGDGHLPAGLSIASKNAQSYGYIGDSAFIVDQSRDLAFGLSAMVFVDRDGVLNDGDYAYADIGRPFLRELGAAVWAYEREAGTRR